MSSATAETRAAKEIAELEEELALMQNALSPQQCGVELRDYIDANAELDILARTSSQWNEWVTDKEQKGKAKLLKDTKSRRFW